MKKIIIVDAQNDFISGSLKVVKGKEMVKKIVEFLNNNPEYKTYYTLDWHGKTNKSFKDNGGIWPRHCEQGTKGAEIDEAFYKLKNKAQRPNKDNMFYKGIPDEPEEYSGYLAKNEEGKSLSEITGEVYVIGFALEYCVLNTYKDFNDNGVNAKIIKEVTAVINQEDADKLSVELAEKGAFKTPSK